MTLSIGQQIKELRLQNNLTLKDVSQATRLSIGFLSQLERGLTDVATDSLSAIAQTLGVEPSYFFAVARQQHPHILRSYEKSVFLVDTGRFIHYHLTPRAANLTLLPRLIEILPLDSEEPIAPYPHAGEEFVHVLEGTLTLFLNEERQELFPGDSAHYPSTIPHNWANYTNKMVRLLVVSHPDASDTTAAKKGRK
jgi:transcriptional regulator with XRE-family HTH domain